MVAPIRSANPALPRYAFPSAGTNPLEQFFSKGLLINRQFGSTFDALQGIIPELPFHPVVKTKLSVGLQFGLQESEVLQIHL